MAYQTGTATDAENLLALFRTFITSHADLVDPAGDLSQPSQAWTEEKYVASGGENGGTELYLRGPGLAASDNIYVNLNLFNDTDAGTDAWSLALWGATSFNGSNDLTEQPGNSPTVKTVPLYDQSMPYWFFANGRRFMIFAQVTASVYSSCYAGFILPFNPNITALEYPYPLYIGASMGRLGLRFSNTNNGDHRSFWNPCDEGITEGGGTLYTPGNFWLGFRNVNSSGTIESNVVSVTSVGCVFPYVNIGPRAETKMRVENIEPLLGGDYLLTDVLLSRVNQDANLRDRYGVLDGVSHISGVSQSSQNTVTVGSDTYIIFQEAFRTGQGDYVAIKQ